MVAVIGAPAIVRADSLMHVVPIGTLVLWGDGIHDDTTALQALIDGQGVIVRPDGTPLPGDLPGWFAF